jgi:5-formyltetrahydrofolate cyclo-ligase
MDERTEVPLAQAKAELRDSMRRLRAALGEDQRATAGLRAAERLLASGLMTGADTVMAFRSFGAEIPTQPLIEALAAGGVRLALPFLREGRIEAAPFRLGDALVPTAFGPLEPADPVALDPPAIDAVVVPGLAFDRSGSRLGYGGGHFDRFLPRLRREVPRVGFAFDLQLLTSGAVPRGPNDEPVHYVVTEREVVDCRAG